jgi:hypothetical protein
LLLAEIEGMKRIIILGGGTGGTLVANRLRRVCEFYALAAGGQIIFT